MACRLFAAGHYNLGDIKGTGVFEGCTATASNPVESNHAEAYQNLGCCLNLVTCLSLAALGVRSHHEQQNPGEAKRPRQGLKEMGSAIISGSDKQVIMRPNCRKTIETPKRWASLEPAPQELGHFCSASVMLLGLFLR